MLDVDSLIKIINNAGYIDNTVNAIEILSEHKWKEKIENALFQKYERSGSPKIQIAISKAFKKMTSTPVDRFLSIIKNEKKIDVKMELIITLGELKWKDEKTISLLMNILNNESHIPMKRRAALSLGKMNVSEEIRRKALNIICQEGITEELNWKERKYIAEAIGSLGIRDESDAFILILKLLEDENEEVKKEAGRSLSLIN